MKFVKAKEPMAITLDAEKVKFEKRPKRTAQQVVTKHPNLVVAKLKVKGKSLPKSQRGPKAQHWCHHCGLQGHTRPNCHKLKVLKNASDQRSRGPRNDKRSWAVESSKGQNGDPVVVDVMKIIGAFTTCLERFTRRFERLNSRTQFYRDITPNARDVWVKRGTHA